MPLLDAATIAALEGVAASARAIAPGLDPLTHGGAGTATILQTTTGSSGGAPTRGGTDAIDVPCYFWNASGNENADTLAQQGKYRMDIAATVDIGHGARVEYQGRAYRVVWVPPPYEAGRIIGLEDV